MKVVRVAALGFYGLALPWCLLFCLEVFCFWQTWKGLLGAVALILLLVSLTCALAAWQLESFRKRLLLASGAAALPVIGIYLILLLQAPDDKGAPLRRHNPRGYPYSALLNLIPERDQVSVGLALSRHLGLLPPGLQGHLDQTVLTLYSRPGYDKLAASTVFCWSDLWRGARPEVDLLYTPAHDREVVLLFLHGSLGGFHSNLALLQQFCDRQGYGLLAPNYGAGFWERPDSEACVLASLDFARSQMGARRIYLMGHSNGALGALKAARRRPQEVSGLISISGLLDGAGPAVPLLILHGRQDELVPFQVAQSWQRRHGGELVEMAGDHALFYTHAQELLPKVSQFVDSLAAP